jgi:uncharacterized RDD family membrane protein YckC
MSQAAGRIAVVARAVVLFFEFAYYYFAIVSFLILLSNEDDKSFALFTLAGSLVLGGALTMIRRRIIGYRLPVPGGTVEHRLRIAGNLSLLAGALLVSIGVSVLVAGIGGRGAVLIVGGLPLVGAALVVRNRGRDAEDDEQTEPSSVGRRLWARAIDVVVLWPATFVVTTLRDALVGTPFDQAYALNGGVIVGIVVYELCAVTLFGGSLGKTITGIRVHQEASGGLLGWGRGALRTIVFIVSISVGPFASLFLFFPYMDPKKRALHDRVAGSLVVQ